MKQRLLRAKAYIRDRGRCRHLKAACVTNPSRGVFLRLCIAPPHIRHARPSLCSTGSQRYQQTLPLHWWHSRCYTSQQLWHDTDTKLRWSPASLNWQLCSSILQYTRWRRYQTAGCEGCQLRAADQLHKPLPRKGISAAVVKSCNGLASKLLLLFL